jgi:hypothetical protein
MAKPELNKDEQTAEKTELRDGTLRLPSGGFREGWEEMFMFFLLD